MSILTASFFFLTPGLLSVAPDAPDDAVAAYRELAKQELAELAKTASTFPARRRATLTIVSKMKEKVRGLIADADTPARRAALASEMGNALGESDTFRFFEYYLIWLGGDLLKVSRTPDVLLFLAHKIDNRDKIAATAGKEIQAELCVMSIEIILDSCDYKPPKPIVRAEHIVDWTEWRALANWIEKNSARLQFDDQLQKWRVAEQTSDAK